MTTVIGVIPVTQRVHDDIEQHKDTIDHFIEIEDLKESAAAIQQLFTIAKI